MPDVVCSDRGFTTAAESVQEARSRMLAGVTSRQDTEQVALHSALGRVLAEPLHATFDSPPADNSAMDGYALRVQDLEAGDGVLPLSQRIPAGHVPEPLAIGTAARIFTGGVIPEGADTVVMQESCVERDGSVVVAGPVHVDRNIRRAGEDMRSGAEVLSVGQRMLPQHLGVAAAAGYGRLCVRRRPRVAILITGDELVSPGRALPPGHIYNSNGPLLQGLVQMLGCDVAAVRHVADSAEETREALKSVARDVDVILSSGGVSIGEEDHVRDAVSALGRLDFHKVSMKPGKPLAFGHLENTLFLGFPGNPVSLFVTFVLFGAPLLRRLQGRVPVFPEPASERAGFSRDSPGKREEYLRVRLEHDCLVPYPHQGSGVLNSVQWAHGLAVIPAGTTVASGDSLDYHSMAELLG